MSGDARFEYEISYGKARVPLYRVYGRPLTGLTPIPESNFTGRDNILVGGRSTWRSSPRTCYLPTRSAITAAWWRPTR
ncbi:MAG: hypothetical protein U0841_12810 [Chloroflexia bacterium]